jgi:hypothetical protein
MLIRKKRRKDKFVTIMCSSAVYYTLCNSFNRLLKISMLESLVLLFAMDLELNLEVRGVCASKCCYCLLYHVGSWSSLSLSTVIDPE